MIKIVIADDQVLMRDGIHNILSTQEDMKVVGLAVNGIEAVQLVESTRPDIVLMDINMPLMNGVEATKQIKALVQEICVIILTTFDDDHYILDALSYGASGYLLKDISGEGLVKAIRDAMNGSLLLPGAIANKLALNLSKCEDKSESDKKNSLSIYEDFTRRELDIIHLLMDGKAIKDISEALFLSKGTVKNYLSSIYGKLGTPDRTGAILRLQQMGYKRDLV